MVFSSPVSCVCILNPLKISAAWRQHRAPPSTSAPLLASRNSEKVIWSICMKFILPTGKKRAWPEQFPVGNRRRRYDTLVHSRRSILWRWWSWGNPVPRQRWSAAFPARSSGRWPASGFAEDGQRLWVFQRTARFPIFIKVEIGGGFVIAPAKLLQDPHLTDLLHTLEHQRLTIGRVFPFQQFFQNKAFHGHLHHIFIVISVWKITFLLYSAIAGKTTPNTE